MEINGELVNEEVRYADLGLSQAQIGRAHV